VDPHFMKIWSEQKFKNLSAKLITL